MGARSWQELFDRAADRGVTVEDVQEALADRRSDD